MIVNKLREPPFEKSLSQHELEVKYGPLELLQLLNDVLAEVDSTVAMDVASSDGTATTLALLKVLRLGVPAAAARDFEAKLRSGDRCTVLALLHWCLSRLPSNKKRLYDARFELPIEAVAAYKEVKKSTNFEHGALWSHFEALEKNLRRVDNSEPLVSPPPPTPPPPMHSPPPTKEIPVVSPDPPPEYEEHDDDHTERPLFEKLLEVGIPPSWDLDSLLAVASADGKETSADPRRTLAQRWKAGLARVAKRILTKKQPGKNSSIPKECIHATEPGAVSPQLVWSYPRAAADALALEVATFCFPDGVKILKQDAESFAFIFNLSVPEEQSNAAASAAGNANSNLLHGVCLVDTRRVAMKDDKHVNLPTCYCLLTRWPFFELHLSLLRGALAFAKNQAIGIAEPQHAINAVRTTLRDVMARYGALKLPKRGGELQFAINDETTLTYRRQKREDSFSFLNKAGDTTALPQLAPSMRWTVREYEAVEGAALWSVPRLFNALSVGTTLRALAAMLCELQLVVVAPRATEASAVVLGLVSLLRPLLWVGPLIPILPTHLHALLEAPVPFVIGAPRTETWAKCLDERLPKPGFVVLDVEAQHIFFHPHDADLLELPHSEALEDSLKPMLAQFEKRPNPLGHQDDPRVVKATTAVLRVVSRHVVKLAGIAGKFESKLTNNAMRRSRLAASIRTRDSIEFAAMQRGEQLTSSFASVQSSRDFVGRSFAQRDVTQSMAWIRQSTELRLRDSLAADPLRRRFFERMAESQSYDVYRESFPTFRGLEKQQKPRANRTSSHLTALDESRPQSVREASLNDTPLANQTWRPDSPIQDSTPVPSKRRQGGGLHAPRRSASPTRSGSWSEKGATP